MASSQQPDPDKQRLRQHFESDPLSTSMWDRLWKDDFVPWDRGTSNPALIDTLSARKDLLGDAVGPDGRRKKAFVPGCGRGYDVLLLAEHGYDAVGLDGSETAVVACEELAAEWRQKWSAAPESVGHVEFVTDDFFASDWERHVFGDGPRGFDVIYDYTFLCALPMTARPRWAQRMVDLLAHGGRLICLEFPTYKDPSTGGPPWAVRPSTYEQHLGWPGVELEYKDGFVVSDSGRKPSDAGLTRIAHWQPKRTHEVGQGTDWVSVWTHKR